MASCPLHVQNNDDTFWALVASLLYASSAASISSALGILKSVRRLIGAIVGG